MNTQTKELLSYLHEALEVKKIFIELKASKLNILCDIENSNMEKLDNFLTFSIQQTIKDIIYNERL